MNESSERETPTETTKATDEDRPDRAARAASESAQRPPDSSVPSDPAWDEVTPPRQGLAEIDGAAQWSASEVTLARAPLAPEAERKHTPLPSFAQEPEIHGETSGTVQVASDRRERPITPRPAHAFAATRAGIELGRPVFAVAAIGAMAALVALAIFGVAAARGVAVGAAVATLNLCAACRRPGVFLPGSSSSFFLAGSFSF
jgi:hypothetical protein